MMPDGRWDDWYQKNMPVTPFGNTVSYQIGADFLVDCRTVEDWGCGLGWFRTKRPDGYVGVDGSDTPHADVFADLRTYRSRVEGIFLRHVLEHNHEWASILDNALASFTKRMVVVLFTPLGDVTEQIGGTTLVPDYSFALRDLVGRFAPGVGYSVVSLRSPETQYGVEHVLLVSSATDVEAGLGG